MSSITNYLTYSVIAAAAVALSIRKYKYSYSLFAFIVGWNILTNFVSGDKKIMFSTVKLPFIVFSIILFFCIIYLTIITFNNIELFEKSLSGDLEFYLNTSNILILTVVVLITSNESLSKSLESILPTCGPLILMLIVFLFIYLLAVMIVNIGIITNKKLTDG